MYFLAVIRKQSPKNVILSSSCNLSDFGYFRQKGIKEFLLFSALTLVERTDPGAKISVTERNFVCSAYVMQNNLAAATVTDIEYKTSVAHMCLEKLLSDFSTKIPRRVWENAEEAVEYPYIEEMLGNFSDAKGLNTFSALQGEIDETRIILHTTIESLLQRGEKLDDLVNKADELSTQTKKFYLSARKTNACCQGAEISDILSSGLVRLGKGSESSQRKF
ncbi:hypothetical protein JTE90_028705 [Oedothorax gibbosus]|uniref:Uncharacterized protein n=1 Tax=Oedothorax gibbosus TaxID=931172 RepID=A0AAV6U3W7_9ARAC|nr:hypothetical protein JTE90_028705 [Oedothorax gibbosus]